MSSGDGFARDCAHRHLPSRTSHRNPFHLRKYLHVEKAKVYYPALQHPNPLLYFGGSSAAGIELAARQVDVYLTWGEPPALVAEKIARVREAAATQGRTVRFGIRLQVIVRETSAAAWRDANDLIRYVDKDVVERARQGLSKFDSEGQRRMAALVQAARRIWKSVRTSGPALAWCAAARGLHWSVTPRPSRDACSNTPASASTASFCPATRIWKDNGRTLYLRENRPDLYLQDDWKVTREATVSSGTASFGKITGAASPRVLQFALRVSF